MKGLKPNAQNINRIFGVQREENTNSKQGKKYGFDMSQEEMNYIENDKFFPVIDHRLGIKKKKRSRLHMKNRNDYKEGRWDSNEHLLFVESCILYGNNWRKVQKEIKTRTSAQIRSHAQKYVIRLCRKYGIIGNKKSLPQFTNTKFSKNKTLCKPLEEIEEDERKILEIFKIVNKDSFQLNSSSYRKFIGDGANINENISSHCQQENEKSESKYLKKQKCKKVKPRKVIFKIIKEDKSSQEDTYEDVQDELHNLVINNEKIISSLLEVQSVSENTENISSFLYQNNCPTVYNFSNFFNSFTKNMDLILNKWNDFVPKINDSDFEYMIKLMEEGN